MPVIVRNSFLYHLNKVFQIPHASVVHFQVRKPSSKKKKIPERPRATKLASTQPGIELVCQMAGPLDLH